MKEQELKQLYHSLENKGNFAVRLGKKLGRSPRTITNHWFSDLPLSGNMPTDKKTLKVIERELLKAPKKIAV